jgi:phage terminase small subunit
MSELTAKQKAFIEELPKNQWNGTKACIAAGYSAKSAGVMAHRLLKNPAIAGQLERRTAEIAEKTDVEVAEIIAALRKIAFGGKKATNSEILRALELLGKTKAMFTDRQITDVGKMTLAEALTQAARQEQQKERKVIEAEVSDTKKPTA